MKTIFIGGSRHVSRLPSEVLQRLDNVIQCGHRVIVGDANGADKSVQKYFANAAYEKVTVFCSGKVTRNNLGQWATHNVSVQKSVKGFQFYAAKDREMAIEADFGLMIWDGESPGTVLNILRLVRAGKIAVLFNIPEKRPINIKSMSDWHQFLSHCSVELQRNLHERATPEEWGADQQMSFLTASDNPRDRADIKSLLPSVSVEAELATSLNAALATSDPTAVVNTLGDLAKHRGMSSVAKDTGLARESLYRALSSDGNPEFATVLKVLSSLGLQLIASPKRFADQ